MTALGKLLRTTAFKLTAAYLVIFVLFAGFLLGYVAWNARNLLFAQVDSTIEAEARGLADAASQGGIRRLVGRIERRTRQPGSSLYLLVPPAGETVAGNIAIPADSLELFAGARQITYAHTDDDARPHQALVRVFALPGGFRLLVGRDIGEAERLRGVIRRAFGWALSLVVVMALLAGWFVTRRVLGRIEAMSVTARSVMDGDLSGRIAVTGTNDELDRLAENLNAMLARIELLMAGLKEVSDNIAHDLKTPLTRLRNGAEAALRGPPDAAGYRRALEGTIEEADGLIRVFNALLMIARAEAGSSHDGMADFDLSGVVRDMVELYEPVAEEAGVPLRLEVPATLSLHGSRELIGQALANLVDNAIKHAPRAGEGDGPVTNAPDLLVKAAIHGDRVEIVVADRGPGIPEADRGRVLDRFVRLEGARSRPGFGLGLSLAAAVARLHGGTLRLEDNVPGLRAILALPVRPGGPHDGAG